MTTGILLLNLQPSYVSSRISDEFSVSKVLSNISRFVHAHARFPIIASYDYRKGDDYLKIWPDRLEPTTIGTEGFVSFHDPRIQAELEKHSIDTVVLAGAIGTVNVGMSAKTFPKKFNRYSSRDLLIVDQDSKYHDIDDALNGVLRVFVDRQNLEQQLIYDMLRAK